MKTFNDVIEHFGSKSGLAKSLGIAPAAVTQWDGVIPIGRAYQIQILTAGEFQAKKYLSSLKGEAA